ncbi:MAG: hypothetical protein M3P24_11740 [Gemmatimonadota bacterium]|nr:hypothetical protein [Gemmatimonadota bacterium]
MEHDTPDCPGRWRRDGGAWRCTGCSASYPLTPGVARATIRENAFGLLLARLTTEGRAAIEGGSAGD